jgi:hypothetical protein
MKIACSVAPDYLDALIRSFAMMAVETATIISETVMPAGWHAPSIETFD